MRSSDLCGEGRLRCLSRRTILSESGLFRSWGAKRLPIARFKHTIPPEQMSKHDAHTGPRMAGSHPQGAKNRCVAFLIAMHDSTGLEKDDPIGEYGA